MRIQAFPSMKLSDDMVVTAIPSMTGRAALQGLLHVAWVGAGAYEVDARGRSLGSGRLRVSECISKSLAKVLRQFRRKRASPHGLHDCRLRLLYAALLVTCGACAAMELGVGVEPLIHEALFQEGAMDNQQKQQFTKGDERVAMAELRKQREAGTTHHRDPAWVKQFWKQVSRS
jgi:hypothetical protein